MSFLNENDRKQTLPARTRGSVCCFEHSVCKWRFSASQPGRSLAFHKAWPTRKPETSLKVHTAHSGTLYFCSMKRGKWSISWHDSGKRTSSSLASKYWRYCCGKTSLKPSKNAWVCSSTPRDSLHSATNLPRVKGEEEKETFLREMEYFAASINQWGLNPLERPDVFLLIFLSYLEVPSIRLQIVSGDFSQDLLVNWEEHLQITLFYVIVPAVHTVIISKTLQTQCFKHRYDPEKNPHNNGPYISNTSCHNPDGGWINYKNLIIPLSICLSICPRYQF